MSMVATREAYGKTLAELVEENENIIVLDADLSGSTKTADARKARPNQHFNFGIAEGNMMSAAAGLAASDKVVFASTFAMFAAGRGFEQIRNSIAYPNMNVKIAATHAGISLGEDGATHQAIEDISLMRSVPNMTVVSPSDGPETAAAIRAVAEYVGPVYVRLGRLGVQTINDNADYKFELGKGVVLSEGQDIAIFATGLMVQEALKAKEILKAEGLNPTVINIHTIKPIDKDLIIETAKTHSLIVTAEEHNVIGGLGSAVAEVLAVNHPTRMIMVGVNDTFGESGKPADLLAKYGINADNLAKQILDNK
ncbi:MAG: transketolase family protein [Erysipelothrix sp.]|nr:transketolase family protein [Erysipelothrix sp.]